jgi:hypothetical protein
MNFIFVLKFYVRPMPTCGKFVQQEVLYIVVCVYYSIIYLTNATLSAL